jgi:hypothetical protein
MMIFHLRIEWAVCWAGASSGGSIIPRTVSRLAVAEPGAGEIGGHIAVEPMGKRKQVLSEAEPNVGKHFQRTTLKNVTFLTRVIQSASGPTPPTLAAHQLGRYLGGNGHAAVLARVTPWRRRIAAMTDDSTWSSLARSWTRAPKFALISPEAHLSGRRR